MDKKKKSGAPGNEVPEKGKSKTEPANSGKQSDEKVNQPSGSQGTKKHGDTKEEKDTSPRGELNAQEETSAQEETTIDTTGKNKSEEDFIVGTDEKTMEPMDKGGAGRKKDSGNRKSNAGREG